MKYGFVKVAAVTPECKTLDIKHNTRRIVDAIIEAHTQGIQVALFPELSVTGYALGDTVFSAAVLKAAEDAARELATATSQRDIVAAVGLPLKIDSYLYNCMVVLARGQVAGIVPKRTLTREEMRHFTPYAENIYDDIEFAGFVTPVHNRLLVKDYASELVMAVDFGGDCGALTRLGANLILRPETQPLLLGSKALLTRSLRTDSERDRCGILYCGAGIGESASRYVYDTAKAAAECGEILAFSRSGPMIVTDIDVERINYRKSRSPVAVRPEREPDAAVIEVKLRRDFEVLDREFEKFPFMPKEPAAYEEILDILASALYARIKFIDAETLVVGVSGGLDSTAVLMVCDRVCETYDFARENVLCCTMPSYASSSRTGSNAASLIRELGMTHRHIPIHDAVTQHLADIGHDGVTEDLTYENAQARERTQILMDLANMTGGLMLGTSDMSEEALGFSTFAGDQIAMFQVAAGITKTTMRGLIAYLAENAEPSLRDVLISVLDTPVSPELKKDQNTEAYLGSYELHDFFLYHFLSSGYSPEKILYLAGHTFTDYPDAEIKKTLRIFFKRFFASQYKRNAGADSVQVFDVALMPWAYSLGSDVAGDCFK